MPAASDSKDTTAMQNTFFRRVSGTMCYIPSTSIIKAAFREKQLCFYCFYDLWQNLPWENHFLLVLGSAFFASPLPSVLEMISVPL